MGNWQKVYSSTMQHQAEIVLGVLQDRGLHPIVVNKRDRLYNNFGDYEVLVSPDEVLQALKIIEDDIVFR